MALDGDTAIQMADWRAKAIAGTISDDEMREFIRIVREGRVSAAATSAKSRAKKEPIDTASLLDEINDL